MALYFLDNIAERRIFDRVDGPDDFCGPGLALGRPECDAGQEAAVGKLKLKKGVGDVAAAKMGVKCQQAS